MGVKLAYSFVGTCLFSWKTIGGLSITTFGRIEYVLYSKSHNNYCNFPYSSLACFRMGMSLSASFQSAKKFS